MVPGYQRKDSPGVYESAFDLTQAAAMAASSSLLFRHPSLQLRVLDVERGSGYVANKLLQRGELLLEAGFFPSEGLRVARFGHDQQSPWG